MVCSETEKTARKIALKQSVFDANNARYDFDNDSLLEDDGEIFTEVARTQIIQREHIHNLKQYFCIQQS